MTEKPTYQIQIIPQSPTSNSIHYTITSPYPDSPAGFGIVGFNLIKKIAPTNILFPPCQELLQQGKTEEQPFCNIAYFFPNGNIDETTDHLMRHGAGSALLERIIEDAQKRSAAALILRTKRPSMKQFANKKGFIELLPSNELATRSYYRLI